MDDEFEKLEKFELVGSAASILAILSDAMQITVGIAYAIEHFSLWLDNETLEENRHNIEMILSILHGLQIKLAKVGNAQVMLLNNLNTHFDLPKLKGKYSSVNKRNIKKRN